MSAELRSSPADSRGRRHPEASHPYRNIYRRDRDRVIHCRAFRRLEHKTQVFTVPDSDHSRNRLTHTIEVSQIARTVAGALDDPAARAAEATGEPGAKKEEPIDFSLPFPLGYTNLERRGYLLARRLKCIDCHEYIANGVKYGREQYSAPRFDDLEAETIEDVTAQLEEPDSDDMPAFTNISAQDRLAVGAFVIRLNRDAAAARKKGK